MDWAESVDASGNEQSFELLALPTELLAGITQRLCATSKVEAERVNNRFAAVAPKHAWRLRRPMVMRVVMRNDASLTMHAGGVRAELTIGAAARFIRRRATIVELRAVSEVPDDDIGFGDTLMTGLSGAHAQMRSLASAMSAPGVKLRALHLEGTTKELFGDNGECATTLFNRHADTLEQATLGVRFYGEPERGYLLNAIRSCSSLRHFSVRLQWVGTNFSGTLAYLLAHEHHWPPPQCALTLFASARGTAGRVGLGQVMPPQLEELHIVGVHLSVWPSHDNIRTLRLSCMQEDGRWSVEDIIIGYFQRSGGPSLSAEVDVQTVIGHQLSWYQFVLATGSNYNQVGVECFDAATCAVEGVALPLGPPPPLPDPFEHNGESIVFKLQRFGEQRHLVLALFIVPPPM